MMGLFPPTVRDSYPYSSLLNGETQYQSVERLDFGKLAARWAIVAVVTAGLIYTRQVDPELKNKVNAVCFRVALAVLLLLGLIVILAGAGYLFHQLA